MKCPAVPGAIGAGMVLLPSSCLGLPCPAWASPSGSVLSQAISVSGSKGQCLTGMWQLLPLLHLSVVLVPCPGDSRPTWFPAPSPSPRTDLSVPNPSPFIHGFPRLPLGPEQSCFLTDSLTAASGHNALATPSAPGQSRSTADHLGLSAKFQLQVIPGPPGGRWAFPIRRLKGKDRKREHAHARQEMIAISFRLILPTPPPSGRCPISSADPEF